MAKGVFDDLWYSNQGKLHAVTLLVQFVLYMLTVLNVVHTGPNLEIQPKTQCML